MFLVTNCGYTVLQAVVVNHPIGAYVLENVRTVDDVGGDGCSAFCLVARQCFEKLSAPELYVLHDTHATV